MDTSNISDNEENITLHLDDMDTTAFDIYLKKHNKCFGSLKDGTETEDNYGNKIYYINDITNYEFKFRKISCSNRQPFTDLLRLIQSSGNLFCIIENKIRGLPYIDVLHNDIKILEKLLQTLSLTSQPIQVTQHPDETHYIFMTHTSPLCALGLAIQYISQGFLVVIVADINVAVLCTLFIELCKKAGLSQLVHLVVSPSSNFESFSQFFKIKLEVEHVVGTAAIITEHADLESAVDILLVATTASVYPWKLTRIFVQENTFERFERALKCKIAKHKDDRIVYTRTAHLPSPGEHEKVFAWGYPGPAEEIPPGRPAVVLDTYRTSGEATALADRWGGRYVSVWSAHLSEADELAHRSGATHVWLNDFGDFDTHVGVAEHYYAGFRVRVSRERVESGDLAISKASKMWNVWRNLDERERKETMLKACSEMADENAVSAVREAVESFSLMTCSVENGRMCRRISLPVGFLYDLDVSPKELVTSLLIGNGSVLIDDDHSYLKCIANAFNKLSIPIVVIDAVDEKDLLNLKYYKDNGLIYCKTMYCKENEDVLIRYKESGYWQKFKCIWTYFGETFAN